MQIINGYSTDHSLENIFQFRLFHMNHPRIKSWRASRHTNNYEPDQVEQFVIDTVPSKELVAVDCAGWTLEKFGFEVQCFESNPLALKYYSTCYIEPDLFTHRPTYANPHCVFSRVPWYLKYSTTADLVNYLEIWCQQTMILNFYERYVQHNYLKYDLLNIVQTLTDLQIQRIYPDVWHIQRR